MRARITETYFQDGLWYFPGEEVRGKVADRAIELNSAKPLVRVRQNKKLDAAPENKSEE